MNLLEYIYSRFDNHSPSTTGGNGNAPSSLDRSVKSERNNGSTKEANNDDDHDDLDESREVSFLLIKEYYIFNFFI